MIEQWVVELIEREGVFSEARKIANDLGKPLLNVGCGGWNGYQRAIKESDVNLDIIPRDVPNFVLGSVEDLSLFCNKQFGAVYCAHVLEHVTDLQKARSELSRVADYQFVITPSCLFPFSWLSPWHRRVFADTQGEHVLVEK